MFETEQNDSSDFDEGAAVARQSHVSHYVGIGASAGGLEAIERFFMNMPPDSGEAFVVIQHLSPDYKSLMVELLSKKTAMTVCRAENGMPVAPNCVYLIPPKKNLIIFHGKLLLKEQEPTHGINLPIDLFLRSLAEDQAEKAVAIILSGTGSDGTRGIRAIKENSGMVMVQSEESAKFNGMPRAAITTGLADFILAPEQMPSELIAYLRHPMAPPKRTTDQLVTDEDNMSRIFAELRERTNVDFTFYKPSTIIRRIERRMTICQTRDIEEYVHHLVNNAGEVMTLYREFLIGVTNFFRDPEVMKTLLEEYLPRVLLQSANRETRLWVAGCSTGEEAYTLAILVREAMERLGINRDIKIFATDIDKEALVTAGNGIYPESITADLNPHLLAKYFYKSGESYQISRSVRTMVVFARHNLIKDPPFTKIDMVSCRNLLIYLQPVLQQKALQMFNFSLLPGGLLLLGSSETVGDMVEFFQPRHPKFKIYESTGKPLPPVHAAMAIPPGEAERYQLHRHQTASRATARHGMREENMLTHRLLEAMSQTFVDVVTVVNEH